MSNNKVKTVWFGFGILNKQHQGWDKLTEANFSPLNDHKLTIFFGWNNIPPLLTNKTLRKVCGL